jgi:hypothetical protein
MPKGGNGNKLLDGIPPHPVALRSVKPSRIFELFAGTRLMEINYRRISAKVQQAS